ncbi:MAG: phosphatase PAP2 family protein [Candidatus Pristimantibacillus sp.]
MKTLPALSLIGLIGFVFVALSIQTEFIVFGDEWMITGISQFESPAVTVIMKGLSFIGSLPFVIPLMVVIALFLAVVLKHRKEIILFVVTICGSALLNVVLKLFFQRERPTLNQIISEAGYSFPSGHSMNACTFYGILIFLLWRHISSRKGRVLLLILSVAMIIGIGISRIYLGVHYPSDVVGAYLISCTWLFIVIHLFQRYFGNRK